MLSFVLEYLPLASGPPTLLGERHLHQLLESQGPPQMEVEPLTRGVALCGG